MRLLWLLFIFLGCSLHARLPIGSFVVWGPPAHSPNARGNYDFKVYELKTTGKKFYDEVFEFTTADYPTNISIFQRKKFPYNYVVTFNDNTDQLLWQECNPTGSIIAGDINNGAKAVGRWFSPSELLFVDEKQGQLLLFDIETKVESRLSAPKAFQPGSHMFYLGRHSPYDFTLWTPSPTNKDDLVRFAIGHNRMATATQSWNFGVILGANPVNGKAGMEIRLSEAWFLRDDYTSNFRVALLNQTEITPPHKPPGVAMSLPDTDSEILGWDGVHDHLLIRDGIHAATFDPNQPWLHTGGNEFSAGNFSPGGVLVSVQAAKTETHWSAEYASLSLDGLPPARPAQPQVTEDTGDEPFIVGGVGDSCTVTSHIIGRSNL